MKKLLFLLALIGVLGCSNDFDLIDEWKDIPVVYGLLSLNDTAHYLRVEKAFLDPTTSALVIAQRPDSLYYDNALVELMHVPSGTRYALSKVDGNLEGYQREPGIFADAPNYLYKIHSSSINLIGGDEYQLIITRDEDLPPITAETIVIKPLDMNSPNAGDQVNFRYELPTNIKWRNNDGVAFYDLTFMIHFIEEDILNPNIFTQRTLKWTVAKRIERTSSSLTTFPLPGIDFYNFMRGELDDGDDTNQTPIRFFTNFDIIVDGGGQEFLDYISVGEANTGITGSQDFPTYTNLSEGQGLFSSRYKLISEAYTLNFVSLDSLKNGSITKDLNFR